MLPIKKIYIDSSFRTINSASSSDFSIALNETINLPDDVVMYCDDIIIGNNFNSISESCNKLYVDYYLNDNAVITHNYKIVEIPVGNYSASALTSVIESALNNNIVVHDTGFALSYDAITNKITFTFADNRTTSPTDNPGFEFWDDRTIRDVGFGDGIAIAYPNSINRVIKINERTGIHTSSTSYASSWVSGFIDMHINRCLYLQSNALSNYRTMSNFGMGNIIKKIPITQPFNSIIFDNITGSFDYLDVSKKTLRLIDFKLVDSENNPIDLQGSNWSFSLIFSIMSIDK